MSVQVYPSPEYPVLHTHVLFEQVAFVPHSALEAHAGTLQTPAPLQTPGLHSSSGSVLALMNAHTPSYPLPFLAAEQA
jgi:hypothetical protein